jgi:glutathione S-transferase
MKLDCMPGACSLTDLIVLEWTSTPYDTVRMNKVTLKAPDYLAMNPSGAVPLLQHGDLMLTDHLAFAEPLASAASPAGRAARRWACAISRISRALPRA